MPAAFSMLLLPALVLAQGQGQPNMVIDALHHDFGTIGADAKVTHRFKVTNRGKGNLNITRVNPTCGCTSTVLGKWTVVPGDSTEIEVTFDPKGLRGLSRKSIQVISDDPANPTQTLTFEADVRQEIMPSTTNVFFQDVVRSEPRKASVKLESGNGKPVRVTDAKPSGAPWLSANTRQAGNDVWVDIALDGRKIPVGKSNGADRLVVRTSSAKLPVIELTVGWDLRASVSTDPVRVAWVEPAGQERITSVTLKQVANRPFRILSARTTNPLVRVDLAAAKGAAPTHRIQVALAAKAKPGSYMEKVILTLDDPDQPELEIRVSASLR